MAAVAAGISQEVILVLALGLPKLAGWNDPSCNRLASGGMLRFAACPSAPHLCLRWIGADLAPRYYLRATK